MVISKGVTLFDIKKWKEGKRLGKYGLTIIIRIKVLKNVAFKDKEPFKSIEVTNWAIKKKLQKFLEVII